MPEECVAEICNLPFGTLQSSYWVLPLQVRTCMQTLSIALQASEARNKEQTDLLLAAESRERQAATDADAARQAIQEARAESAKLSSEAISTQETMQGCINALQRSYDEAVDAQATANQSLRMREEEIAQLHNLLQGLCSLIFCMALCVVKCPQSTAFPDVGVGLRDGDMPICERSHRTGMIQRTEVEDIEAELRELQVQVPELQETIRVQNEKMADLGSQTPRPEWHSQRRMLPESEQHIVPISRQACKPTAVVAAKLVSRLSHYASQLDVRSVVLGVWRGISVLLMLSGPCACVQEATRDRDNLQMMLAPDPQGWSAAPGCVCDGDGGKEIFVQACGCGGDVPRVLRAEGQVLLPQDAVPVAMRRRLNSFWCSAC